MRSGKLIKKPQKTYEMDSLFRQRPVRRLVSAFPRRLVAVKLGRAFQCPHHSGAFNLPGYFQVCLNSATLALSSAVLASLKALSLAMRLIKSALRWVRKSVNLF